MDHAKIVPADLDSPYGELSVRGLGFVILALFWGFYFSCASTGGAIQLCVCSSISTNTYCLVPSKSKEPDFCPNEKMSSKGGILKEKCM